MQIQHINHKSKLFTENFQFHLDKAGNRKKQID